MKKLPLWICILICLLLVSFGLVYGTVSGFSGDKARVTALLEQENGLKDMISYYGADGLNLAAVAARHLPEQSLSELKEAAGAVNANEGDLPQQKRNAARMAAAADAVTAELEQTDSWQTSERDQRYTALIRSDMQQLVSGSMIDTYNQAADRFNASLQTVPAGWLARLAGITACPVYR